MTGRATADAPRPAAGPSRRALLQAGAVVSGAALSGCRALSRCGRAAQPNIVLVVSDQHSQRAIGAFGSTAAQTPNLDRLVASGTTFTESFCSDPVCCPSRAALLTSRPSCETGVLLNMVPLREDIPDIGAWLREHSDHEPFYMGKWHIPGRDAQDSFTLLNPAAGCGEVSDAATLRTFEGFLASRSSARPFFAVVAPINPHDISYWAHLHPSGIDLDSLGLVESDLPELPPNFVSTQEEAALYQRLRRHESVADGAVWPEVRWRLYRWGYDRYVEMLDGVVGRLVDLVRNSRFDRDTVIIYTSDHGEMAGEHRLIYKGDFYDASVKVPLVVSWPGEVGEEVVDRTHLVSGLDMTPTICDLVGIPPPPIVRGTSMLPLLRGEGRPGRDFVQAQCWVEGRMLRTATHKYVSFRDDPVEQLFDVRNDPWETRDLARDPAAAGVLAELRALQRDHEATLEHTDLALAGYDAAAASLAKGYERSGVLD